MNPTVQDILAILERIAPAAAAEDWDNPGLQIGNPLQEVGRIMTSLDPSLSVVREASRRKVQMLLTHHPLIFPSLSSVNRRTYPGDVIFEACEAHIAILAAHTNLDAAQGGINDMLASLFRLANMDVLQEDPTHPQRNIGRVGDLPEPQSLLSFAAETKRLLRCRIPRVSGDLDRQIRRVALVGGSGGSLVPQASAMGADVLVTGDVGHHDALRAKSLGLALVDAGHFETEKIAFGLFTDAFKDILKREGWAVAVEAFEEESNPMQWI
ncbi:MAG: Nif3-like dinuclear metal center hexameric protein [Desulfatiglandales bacterium]